MSENIENRQECQFEVWTECNSQCKFCYLSTANIRTPDEIKLKQMNEIIEKINDPTFCDKFNKIAFIGGEFFQGQLKNPEVKKTFMHMFDIVSSLLNENKIDEVWCCATLTIGDQEDMYEVLSKFNDLSKVWILTSYDTIGRFHTKAMKDKWISNVQNLRNTYKDIKINITTIITGDFIDKYLDGSLDLFDLAGQFDASVFLKHACPINRDAEYLYTKQETNKIIPNFFPTRNQFLSFLYKFKENENSLMYDKLFNMKYRSSYLFRFDEGKLMCSHRLKDTYQEVYEKYKKEHDYSPCGHSNQYQMYVDSDGCAVCDKEKIMGMFND